MSNPPGVVVDWGGGSVMGIYAIGKAAASNSKETSEISGRFGEIVSGSSVELRKDICGSDFRAALVLIERAGFVVEIVFRTNCVVDTFWRTFLLFD